MDEHQLQTLSDADRLARVSSLYGPGTIGCWLCTVASVFVSWLLNRKARRKDSITNDFLACLSLPAIAAAHMIYQVATFPSIRETILVTDDPALLPRVAAIEAALNTSETFAPLALGLFALSAVRLQMKRCLSAAGVGLLAFGAESGLFILSPRAPISSSNFSRPFLVNDTVGMISIMTVTFGIAILLLVSWLRLSSTNVEHMRTMVNSAEDHHRHDDSEMAMTQPYEGHLCHASKVPLEKLSFIATYIAVLYVPISLLTTISYPLGAWGYTALGAAHSFAWRLRFFIPESMCQVTDLDQAVALGGGIATLAFSCWEAYQARRYTGQSDE